MKTFASLALAAAVALQAVTLAAAPADADAFVQVSRRDPRYFELSNGQPFIPIGLNLIAPSGPPEAGLERMDRWMGELARHGGNFIRVWLSSPFWDIEHDRSGVYDEARAERIDRLLGLARRHGLRVKFTLEHFREMSDQPRQAWANKPLHLVARGGTAESMADFFRGEASRERFRQKLRWLARRYADDPTIFAWELWNEIDAVRAKPEDFLPWTAVMLAELHRLFPRHLALQSLGSYDTATKQALYRQHSLLAGNDAAQVHRYLDLGAPLDLCHGPMDILTADAVRDLLGFTPGRPVVLAESGAVEPKHTGPFALYSRDTDGMLLHDVLFAPFFAGAAAAGQIWHWDVYVDRNRLWPQFGRFAAVVRGLDPAGENFQPRMLDHSRLRVYALAGRTTTLIWCRDAENTWQTELQQALAPERISGARLKLTALALGPRARVQTYDPWTDIWTDGPAMADDLPLPSFTRSIVVRFTLAPKRSGQK